MPQYDELAWLLEQTKNIVHMIVEPLMSELSLADWFARVGDEDVFWHLLRIGVIAPRDTATPLQGKAPREAAGECALTKRGERLRALLMEQDIYWDEMVVLGYLIRQGKIFDPLYQVARAYRPGGGLDELDLGRMIYELENIYAPRLDLDSELRWLQCLGFICPREGSRAEGWYAQSWTDGTIQISPRGRALLAGFRQETTV